MCSKNISTTEVKIYTDGSSLGNPGPGGWGAILVWGETTKEISQGYRETTNNRMEIRGVLHALEYLTRPCVVHIFSDSKYVVDAISKGWLVNWQRNGWRTANKKEVKNRDLWEQMIRELQRHKVHFHWIKAHAGHPENERCDELAKKSAMAEDMIEDVGYMGEV